MEKKIERTAFGEVYGMGYVIAYYTDGTHDTMWCYDEREAERIAKELMEG